MLKLTEITQLKILSEQEDYIIIHSARNDGIKDVAIVIEKELSKSMTSYEQTSERIIRVNLDTNLGPATIIQVYVLYTTMKLKTSTTYFNKKSIQHQQSRLFSLLENSVPDLVLILLD